MKQYVRDNLARARIERVVEQTMLQGPQRLADLARLCNSQMPYMCRFLRRLVDAEVLVQPRKGRYSFLWHGCEPEFEPSIFRGVEFGEGLKSGLVTDVRIYKVAWLGTEPSIFQVGWTGSGVILGWIHANGDQKEVIEWGSFQSFMGRIRRKDPKAETPTWRAILWRRIKFLFRF